MLTADLVNVKRKDHQLILVPLKGEQKARALILAQAFLSIAQTCKGKKREEFEQMCMAVEVDARDKRLAAGLNKLIVDQCEFDENSYHDAIQLRRAVFLRANELRQGLKEGEAFDRQCVIREITSAYQMEEGAFEDRLYGDLRAAHRILVVPSISAETLVEMYNLAQAQAVLLRAVQVTVHCYCSHIETYRFLFHRIKFLRLLYQLERSEGGYRIRIDGPYSMFEAVTKYGLQLALLLPVLMSCDEWSLHTEVRWSRRYEPLTFTLQKRDIEWYHSPIAPAESISDEVKNLVSALEAIACDWTIELGDEILDLPGVGCCVPDLVFRHRKEGCRVYVEILGYWSRAAVWKRVELVQQGLSYRILFAVSERLRVSEQVLEDYLPGALYTYRGSINPRVLLKKVEQLATREETLTER
ncbi:hypothetical protein BCY86_08980 [Pajaroellobacter abortibovis]|uniref:DUF790 family protein n=1 Tax=Pajaroellobacter abortibovis TaxID=1882918 RepID=A0A1L6MZH2_9BACT|nr:hypothetical protein BCY86_08980 [Pajaroellobacter abortibovis]